VTLQPPLPLPQALSSIIIKVQHHAQGVLVFAGMIVAKSNGSQVIK
jgi:hypothetical protein